LKIDIKKRNNIIIVGVAFAIFLLTIIDYISVKKISDSKILMDTAVEITVYGIGRDKEKLKSAIDKGFKEIERVENLLSNYIKDSEISKINNAKGGSVDVSKETADILKISRQVGELTDGAFDITLGELIDLWGITGDNPAVPDAGAIEEMLKHTGNEKIVINGDSTGKAPFFKVHSAAPRTKIDLGGIAKGYAIKKAAEALIENGIKSGLIDAGGDIVVIGEKKGKPFKVGIKSPDSDGMIGIISARDISIVTSGDYERCFIQDGVKYHHVLDPANGYPAGKCRSVTVITKDATIADALSTAVFVMGAEEGMELVDLLDGVEALIVDDKNKVHLSKNASNLIKLK
jgi:thiamine biosynthesis lipoprotein